MTGEGNARSNDQGSTRGGGGEVCAWEEGNREYPELLIVNNHIEHFYLQR